MWFNIGSVDSFERNLENAQIDLNVEPQNFIPVVYKSEIDSSNVRDVIPTLLVIGNAFFDTVNSPWLSGAWFRFPDLHAETIK